MCHFSKGNNTDAFFHPLRNKKRSLCVALKSSPIVTTVMRKTEKRNKERLGNGHPRTQTISFPPPAHFYLFACT